MALEIRVKHPLGKNLLQEQPGQDLSLTDFRSIFSDDEVEPELGIRSCEF